MQTGKAVLGSLLRNHDNTSSDEVKNKQKKGYNRPPKKSKYNHPFTKRKQNKTVSGKLILQKL